jgi:hypothetical protein
MRWACHVEYTERMRNAYKILFGRTEGKRLHRRPRHRREIKIRMDGKVWTGFM